ncbi:penicillin-binding protein activator [Nitrospinaceae bacterium]|nr:penicillin-binding protein activator [Nitrospinaceae bacterium]
MTILPSQKSLKKHVTIIFIFIYYLIFPFQSDAQLEHSEFFNQKQYGTPGNEAYGKPFMEAENLFHSGKFMAAKPFYHSYLEQFKKGKRRSKAFFRLGLIDQNAKSYSTALRFYHMLLNEHPNDLLINDIKFNMAVCNFEIGKFDAAEKLFITVIRKSLDKKKKWKSLYFLSRLDGMRFGFDKAISKLKKVYEQVDDREMSKQAFKLTVEMISSEIGERVLSSLLQKYGKGFPADLLLLKKLSLHREKRDIKGYKSVLEKFLYEFPEHKESKILKSELKKIQTDNGSQINVGVVLPLTGKLAATGQKVLQGIQLAYNHLPEASRDEIFLNVQNSSGSSGVEEILRNLARNPKTVGVLGPLLSDEIKQSADVADLFKLPIFSPTASSADLVETSPFIFRNALTRKIQARFLAKYSINTLKLRRFVVLYPMEPFGEELKDEFVKAVESFGGEVVGVSSYDRSQNDFKNQILALGGLADDDLDKITRKQILGNKDRKDFSDPTILSRPTVDMEHRFNDKIENLQVSLELGYDAIFIPGVYDKVGLIIPQLAFYNIDRITLLGANGWNSPDLINMAGKYLKSNYFVDGFYLDSHQVGVKSFVEQFQNNYGESPSQLSAQAYDAAGIIFKSIISGADNRLKLRDSLIMVNNYPGVTGKTNLLESGDSEKNIFALTVRKKGIVEEK